MQGTHAYFGTYSVNEADKTLIFHVEGNTFPNQEGIDTIRLISFEGEQFRWTTPAPSVGGDQKRCGSARNEIAIPVCTEN